jgi:hypothetical protein
MLCLRASKFVDIEVPSLAAPIQDYLSQTERLVYALVDPNQVELLGNDTFRLRMRPIKFMMLSLQPISDVQVYLAQQQVVIQSDTCQLLGQEALNKRFALNLQGLLWPEISPGQRPVRLRGEAHLQVKIDLPTAFRLTPKPLLESTGNSILNGILMTIKQRLLYQLVEDYTRWASDQMAMTSVGALRRR